mmetsp:Transcript_1534/g.4635  ORF Transcript_1534/g.4635 Transcript_1534/m.4635 type:complete len:334 (-) Transcript_1534:288-1289(-)
MSAATPCVLELRPPSLQLLPALGAHAIRLRLAPLLPQRHLALPREAPLPSHEAVLSSLLVRLPLFQHPLPRSLFSLGLLLLPLLFVGSPLRLQVPLRLLPLPPLHLRALLLLALQLGQPLGLLRRQDGLFQLPLPLPLLQLLPPLLLDPPPASLLLLQLPPLLLRDPPPLLVLFPAPLLLGPLLDSLLLLKPLSTLQAELHVSLPLHMRHLRLQHAAKPQKHRLLLLLLALLMLALQLVLLWILVTVSLGAGGRGGRVVGLVVLLGLCAHRDLVYLHYPAPGDLLEDPEVEANADHLRHNGLADPLQRRVAGTLVGQPEVCQELGTYIQQGLG